MKATAIHSTLYEKKTHVLLLSVGQWLTETAQEPTVAVHVCTTELIATCQKHDRHSAFGTGRTAQIGSATNISSCSVTNIFSPARSSFSSSKFNTHTSVAKLSPADVVRVNVCVVTLDVADVDALLRGDKLTPSMDVTFRKEIVGSPFVPSIPRTMPEPDNRDEPERLDDDSPCSLVVRARAFAILDRFCTAPIALAT